MTSPARPLADRRPSVNINLGWRAPGADPNAGPIPFRLGVGLHEDGAPGEVFCTGPKAGSEFVVTLDDVCVLCSRLHQRYGISFSEMASLMHADADGVLASPVALVVSTVARIERDGVAAFFKGVK